MPGRRKRGAPARYGSPIPDLRASKRIARDTDSRSSPITVDNENNEKNKEQQLSAREQSHQEGASAAKESSIIWLNGVDGLKVSSAKGLPGWLDVSESIHKDKHPEVKQLCLPVPKLPTFEEVLNANGNLPEWRIHHDGKKPCLTFNPAVAKSQTTSAVELPLVPNDQHKASTEADSEIRREDEESRPESTRDINMAVVKETGNIALPFHSGRSLLNAHIPMAIKQKIWGFEYISLADLLPEKHDPDVDLPMSLSLSQDNRSLVFKPQRKKVFIESFHTWSRAFNIYVSILLQKHPNLYHQLLAYVDIIRIASESFPSNRFLRYDKAFRLSVACNPLTDWSVIDQTLWSLELSFPPNQSQPKSPSFCYSYNYQGSCHRPKGACRFTHACMKCRGKHPSKKCYSSDNSQKSPTTAPASQAKNYTTTQKPAKAI